MSFRTKLALAQGAIQEFHLDGWLLYDFRRSNSLACEFLEIHPETMLTRRFFYFIPRQGDAIKIVHRVEATHLDHLPGQKCVYSSWKELEALLQESLQGIKKVAMEYSPRCAIPYLSKVDGGTLELVRGFGVEVVSSADLLQSQTVMDEEQAKSHRYAADVLDEAVSMAWNSLAACLREGMPITEYEVQQGILAYFAKMGCITEGDPIVAVNGHAADPHYTPTATHHAPIKPGDFVLIDLWCKKKGPRNIYADICRVGVAAAEPTEEQLRVFETVRAARDAGIALVKERFQKGVPVKGWEVDQCCRDVIEKAGYGTYFVHRTGHNIFTRDHGDGAHLDNLETRDSRTLLPGTCFSIEPGIYLPDRFGVRMEVDVIVDLNGNVEVTGGVQRELTCLLTTNAASKGE